MPISPIGFDSHSKERQEAKKPGQKRKDGSPRKPSLAHKDENLLQIPL